MDNYYFTEDLLAELGEIPQKSIISKTIHKHGEQKAILFGFAAGEMLSEHTTAQPAVLHFLKGQARLMLAADEMTVESGAWAYMPANMPHSIEALSDVVMLLLML